MSTTPDTDTPVRAYAAGRRGTFPDDRRRRPRVPSVPALRARPAATAPTAPAVNLVLLAGGETEPGSPHPHGPLAA